MSDVPARPSEEATEWPTDAPIVFALRPTKYEVVRSDQLETWERAAAANFPQALAAGGTGTWSFSPIGDGYDTFDDSDWMPIVLSQ